MQKLKLIGVWIAAAFAAAVAAVKESAHDALKLYTYRAGIVLYGGDPFGPYQFPTVQDLEAYKIQNEGTVQIVRQSLYDTVLYPTAGAAQISFFTQPLGGGQSMASGAAAGVAKTKFDTNMVVSGQLPRFQKFIVESIEVFFLPGSVSTANLFVQTKPGLFTAVAAQALAEAVNDVNGFYQGGYLSFDVSSGNILTEAPLALFPRKTDVGIDGSVSTNSATTGQTQFQWASAKGRPYMLQPLVTLQDNAQFSVTLNWGTVFATPSGFNGSVRVRLDGYNIRATQ